MIRLIALKIWERIKEREREREREREKENYNNNKREEENGTRRRRRRRREHIYITQQKSKEREEKKLCNFHHLAPAQRSETKRVKRNTISAYMLHFANARPQLYPSRVFITD